jgi:hypothetical protein
MPSFKVEVIADSSGQWCSNGQRFATRQDAEQSGADLAMRWTAVRDFRVVESEDEPNEKTAYIKGPNHRVRL